MGKIRLVGGMLFAAVLVGCTSDSAPFAASSASGPTSTTSSASSTTSSAPAASRKPATALLVIVRREDPGPRPGALLRAADFVGSLR
jgi:hypothetical protein